MKSIVFIFVPVELNGKRELHIDAELPSQVKAVDEPAADVSGGYPFWTWFLPNPRPQSKARKQ